MNGYPTDKLISGTLIGALVTTVLIILSIRLDIPPERHYGIAIRLALPALVSACLIFPRPILLRTVLKKRRNPVWFDEDLNLLIVGRAVGLVAGIFIGLTLASEIF